MAQLEPVKVCLPDIDAPPLPLISTDLFPAWSEQLARMRDLPVHQVDDLRARAP